MKKILSLLIVLVMMMSFNIISFADDSIYVTLDGNYIVFDVKPQIIDGRTMVPIRAIFEKMGAVVSWDSSANTAVCTKGNTVVKMTVNSMDMYINNQLVRMDVSPVIIDGRTLAPARFVAEAFGANVLWDQNNRTVVITSNMVTLYALDGRTINVSESDVPAYLNVGWYKTLAETQQTMYAADGRTITVYKAEVPAYKNVGWYETKAQAEAANRPATPTTPTTTTPAKPNNSGQDGYYYRTPTGKRYHLDPDCGGKNSYRTTELSGLTPCQKCAK